jgi:Taurine catabolism dioxygenase TauD, TfdA family
MRRFTVIWMASGGSSQMVSSPQQTAGAKRNHGIDIAPLTLHIGAEINGVDLTKPLPPDQLEEVRNAFLKWKVVFFRGQHLDHAQHVALARQFGEPTIGHAVFGRANVARGDGTFQNSMWYPSPLS